MKHLGGLGLTKLIELISKKFATKDEVTNITDTDIINAWDLVDPINDYIENNVYSMTDEEIAAAWNDINIDASTNDGTVNGDLYVNGDVYASHVYNAVYNDYAEWFPRGEETEPGDVIVLDIDHNMKERYIKSRANNKHVVGVHSDDYAMIIGGDKGANKKDNEIKYIPVSLMGRIKVKYIGPAKKGNYVVASEIEGVARAYNKDKDSELDIFGFLVEEDNKINEIRRLKIKIKGR